MRRRSAEQKIMSTDGRVSLLRKDFVTVEVSLKLYQLDLLKIMRALKRVNNKRLAAKFRWYINRYDEIAGQKTNYRRKSLPKIRMEDYE